METHKISLSCSANVSQVEQLHAEATQAIQTGRSVEFDLSETTDLDASVLQLLIAASKARHDEDVAIEVVGMSDNLKKSLASVGATAWLPAMIHEGNLDDSQGMSSQPIGNSLAGNSSDVQDSTQEGAS